MLLVCRSLVSIHTLSSFVFFNQVSVSIMKSVFSNSLVSTISCCLFFTDLTFTVLFLCCLSYFYRFDLFVLGFLYLLF